MGYNTKKSVDASASYLVVLLAIIRVVDLLAETKKIVQNLLMIMDKGFRLELLERGYLIMEERYV
ncbi:hypothetical protein MCO_01210 [Bartonella sp. DB5-6]|uniref:hypothetical protein n=1 Tax=Bartonella sp. DB5-6 TaxID=1094755 RepID=UPI00026E9E6F|nr:hypothetical protein [Bartonella sp. DB5-6]EJF77479.1 hypothetical protein MCO_01210 [Bartonella sp. DB5-6]